MTKYFVDLSNGTTLYVEADEYAIGYQGGFAILVFTRGTNKDVIVSVLNPIAWGLIDCVDEAQK